MVEEKVTDNQLNAQKNRDNRLVSKHNSLVTKYLWVNPIKISFIDEK